MLGTLAHARIPSTQESVGEDELETSLGHIVRPVCSLSRLELWHLAEGIKQVFFLAEQLFRQTDRQRSTWPYSPLGKGAVPGRVMRSGNRCD